MKLLKSKNLLTVLSLLFTWIMLSQFAIADVSVLFNTYPPYPPRQVVEPSTIITPSLPFPERLAAAEDGDTVPIFITDTIDFQIEITKSIILMGVGDEQVVLNGDKDRRLINIDVAITETVQIENIYFIHGSETRGGCIRVARGHLVLRQSTFFQCAAETDTLNDSASGGAIYLRNNATLSVYKSEFVENSSMVDGGAIFAESPAAMFVEDSKFHRNFAVRGSGGAVFAFNRSSEIVGSSFVGNYALLNGGAIVGNELRIERSSIVGSRAQHGAVYVRDSSAFAIENTSILNNTGYGLFVEGSAEGQLSLATLYQNVPADSNSVGNDGAILLTHTVLNLCEGVSLSSLGHNAGSCSSLDQSTDIVGDPLLSARLVNDSIVYTGSSIVDKGNILCGAFVDQVGNSRPRDGVGDGREFCDIGAYEHIRQFYFYLPAIFMSGR